MFKYNLYDGFLGQLIQTCHSRSSFEQVVQCELESHQIQGPIDMTTSFSTQQKPSFAPFILEGSTSSDVYNFLALYLPMDVDQKQQEQQDLEKAAKDQIKEEDEDQKNNKLMNHMFLDPCTSYSFYLFCSQSLITLMNKENKKSVCTSWLPEVPTTQLYNKNEEDEEVVLKRYSADIKNRSAVLLETLNRQLALQALSKSIVNASRDYTDKTRHLARSLETLKQFLDEVVPNGTDALIQEMKKVPCIDGRDETTLLDLVNQELYDGNPQGEKQFLDAAEAPIRAKVAYLTTLNTVTQNVIASYLHDTERSVQLIVGSCISASTDIDHLQSIVQKSSAMNKNQTMELSIMVQQVNQMYEQYVRFYSNKTALLSDTILSLLSPYRKIASMQTAVQANMNYNTLESSMNDLLGDYEFPSLYREAKQELLRQSEFYNEIDKHTVKFYNLLSNLISDEKLERSKFQDQLSNNIPSYGSNHRLYPFFARLSLDEAIALPPYEHFSLPRHDGLPKVANPFEVVEDDEWEKVETEDVETRTSPRTTSGDSEDECQRNAQVPRGTSQSDHMLLEQIKKLEEDLDMKDSIISALGQQNEDLAMREAKLQTVIEEKEKANVEIEEKCRSIVEGSKETNAELVNKYEQHITRLELMIDDLELRDKEQTHQIDVLNEDNKGLQEITTAMNKVVAKEKKSNQDLLDEIQHLKKQIQSSGIVSERTISLESEIFHLKKENTEMKRDAQLNLATIKELTEKIQSLNAQQSMMQHSIHSEFMKKEEEIIAKDTNLSRQNSDILRLLTSDKEQRSAIDLLRKELMTVKNQRDSLAQDLQFAQEHASLSKRVQDALMDAGRFLNNQVDQAQQTIHTLQTKEEFVDKSLQANHLIDIMRILANSVLVVTQSLFNACKPLDLELFENNLEAVTEYIQEMLSNMETISEYLSNKISQNAPNDDLSSVKVSDIQNGDLVFIMRRSPTVYEVMNFDGKKMFLSPECVDSLEGEKRTDKFLRGYVFTTEIAEGDPLRITTEKDYTLVYLNAL